MCPVLLTIDGSVIKVTDSVHDLGIILRVDMSMKDQIVQYINLYSPFAGSKQLIINYK